MKLLTELFGEIEIEINDIIDFPQGLVGLEDNKKFILLDVPENSFFKWLQSVDNTSLGFLITNPFQFIKDFEVEINESDKEFLGIQKSEESVIFVIVTIPGDDVSKITANLLGPVIVNTKNRKAKQIVLSNEKYSTKVPLFQKHSNIVASSKEECR